MPRSRSKVKQTENVLMKKQSVGVLCALVRGMGKLPLQNSLLRGHRGWCRPRLVRLPFGVEASGNWEQLCTMELLSTESCG